MPLSSQTFSLVPMIIPSLLIGKMEISEKSPIQFSLVPLHEMSYVVKLQINIDNSLLTERISE